MGGYRNGGKSRLRTPLCGTVLTVALVTVFAAGGCKRSEGPSATAAGPAPRPIEEKVERGPVKMTVRVDKDRATIADKLKLTIEVTAADGVDVEMPAFGNKLSNFEIHDFTEHAAVPGASGRTWTQNYVLEGFLSGDYEIPSITAKFTDRRRQAKQDAKPIQGELAGAPFTIKVTSLLGGQFDPAKFRDIKGTVELPVEPSRAWLWWTLGTAGGLTIMMVGLWLLKRYRNRVVQPVRISPYERAFHALLRLEDDRLIEQGMVHEFYFRLTDIVRQYIEGQFGIMAPERTTDEFLREVRDHQALSSEYQGLLGTFLQAADLVKFALYRPEPGETELAFSAARNFVDQTGQLPPASKRSRLATAEAAA